jgi:hypothetical protein
MVRLAADVASWQTKMSSAAAMVSLPSAAYPPCASQRDGRHRAPPHTLARHSKGHEGEAGQPVRRGLPGRPHHQPSLVITSEWRQASLCNSGDDARYEILARSRQLKTRRAPRSAPCAGCCGGNAGRRDAGAVVADDSRGLAVGDHEPVELAGHSAEKRSSVPPHTCKPSPLTGGGGDPKSLLSRANVSTS